MAKRRSRWSSFRWVKDCSAGEVDIRRCSSPCFFSAKRMSTPSAEMVATGRSSDILHHPDFPARNRTVRFRTPRTAHDVIAVIGSLIEFGRFRVILSKDVSFVTVASINHDLVADPHDQQGCAAATVQLSPEPSVRMVVIRPHEMALRVLPGRCAKGDPCLVNHFVLI